MNPAENPGEDRGRPGVSWSAGVVRLRDAHLFGPRGADAPRHFLRRIFGLDAVRSVAIDRAGGTATIDYIPDGLAIGEALARMAAAIGDEPAGDDALHVPPLGDLARFKVFRFGTLLTTWEVVHELPGRVRIRQEQLRDDAALARRIEGELGTVHGVIEARATPLTAGLLVHFDPASTSTRRLLQALEGLCHAPGTCPTAGGHHHPHHPPVSFALANASVALAAVGELAVPALLPASAVLLLGSNVKTFREAGRALRRRQLGLPVLSTFIVVATLSTGQFLVAALMSWSIKFWHRRYRARLHETRRRLLAELTQQRGFARSWVGDTPVEIPVESLREGDVIAVEPQEVVAADGRIVSGEAMVDERPVRGGQGLSRKATGDAIFAGSWIIAGSVRVEVSGHGTGTRAATIGRALVAASATSPAPFAVTSHGAAFARGAVGPTLALAGLGLLVGDTATAAAILRPDYATGPGMGVGLHLLHDLAGAAREGVLIRDAAALRRFAEVDTIVFDDHPALRRQELKVARVLARGDASEEAILRYAATAHRELADGRSRALRTECAARGIPQLDLDLPPRYLGPGIDVVHDREAGPINVREAGGIDLTGTGRAAEPGEPAPLLVSAAGREIGMVVFEHSERPGAAAVVGELRDGGGLAVGLLSDRPGDEIESLAAALGADFHRAGLSADARAECLRSYGARGMKVAYVGDCRRDPAVASAAYVAVSLADVMDLESDQAPIVLLGNDLDSIAGLRALARAHVSRTHAIHGSILIPNLVCVAGAFLLGFTSIYSVVLTNLGILGVDIMTPRSPTSGRDRVPNVS